MTESDHLANRSWLSSFRVMSVLSVVTILLGALFAIAPAFGMTSPEPSFVVTGEISMSGPDAHEGTEYPVVDYPIPADYYGQMCGLTFESLNNESVHRGNDLYIYSLGIDSTPIVLTDVESESADLSKYQHSMLLGTNLVLKVKLGPEEWTSLNVKVDVTCETTTTTTAEETTTTGEETTTTGEETTTTGEETTSSSEATTTSSTLSSTTDDTGNQLTTTTTTDPCAPTTSTTGTTDDTGNQVTTTAVETTVPETTMDPSCETTTTTEAVTTTTDGGTTTSDGVTTTTDGATTTSDDGGNIGGSSSTTGTIATTDVPLWTVPYTTTTAASTTTVDSSTTSSTAADRIEVMGITQAPQTPAAAAVTATPTYTG